MTDAPPISYGEARDVIVQWLFHIKKAGPDAFEMTREKYVDRVGKLDDVKALFEAIVAYRAQRAEAQP